VLVELFFDGTAEMGDLSEGFDNCLSFEREKDERTLADLVSNCSILLG
jgi:hypothetical protein